MFGPTCDKLSSTIELMRQQSQTIQLKKRIYRLRFALINFCIVLCYIYFILLYFIIVS